MVAEGLGVADSDVEMDAEQQQQPDEECGDRLMEWGGEACPREEQPQPASPPPPLLVSSPTSSSVSSIASEDGS